MNKSYVPSSSHAQSAEELIKGALRIYIDIVSHFFTFKYTGSSFDPLYIDPVNRAIMNVQFLNDVDISKLIGGVAEGYGIVIKDLSKGIYEINVKDGMFALKTELDEVDKRFDDYTTTADLEANYATIAKVNEVDNKFANYTTSTDLEAKYAKKGDVVPTESEFDSVEGYPYFTVKNSQIIPGNKPMTGIAIPDQTFAYNLITIDVPPDVKTSIMNKATGKVDVLRFILRKNIVYEGGGKLVKEFVCYIQDQKVYSPVITSKEDGTCYINYHANTDNEFYIAFDINISFTPYKLYMEGNLSIMYLLSQNALVAKQPTLKCNIIEAKNALKLHESDVYYFYKPNIITEESFRSDSINYNCYKMVFEIPEDYIIPNGLEFTFTEHCFGNAWKLRWDGSGWEGDDMKGRSNGKVIKLLERIEGKNPYNSHGCYVMMKHTAWNEKLVYHSNTETNLMYNFWLKGRRESKVLLRNGEVKLGSDYSLNVNYFPATGQSYASYDLLGVECLIANYDTNTFQKDIVDKIYVDIYACHPPFTNQTYTDVATRLVFRVGDIHHDSQNNLARVDIYPELDTIEKVNYRWSIERFYWDETGTKRVHPMNLMLYLNKDLTDPVDEVNWDPTTNAFDYIIQQQFYEITPNPNATTTLYTDFSITSSKIITADNKTTMRSDLNIVTNNVDVMSYDVKEINQKVDSLGSAMVEQQLKTQYLKVKTDEIDIKANVGIALGVAGCVLGATGIGMAGKAISFAKNAVWQTKQ